MAILSIVVIVSLKSIVLWGYILAYMGTLLKPYEWNEGNPLKSRKITPTRFAARRVSTVPSEIAMQSRVEKEFMPIVLLLG